MSAAGLRSPLVLRLDDELRERLQKLAERRQDTLSATARVLLAEGLQRHDSALLSERPDAPDIVLTLARIARETALVRGIAEEQARVLLGMEQLLCHWAARSDWDVPEDDLLEELRRVGAEELWRELCSWLRPQTSEAESEEKA